MLLRDAMICESAHHHVFSVIDPIAPIALFAAEPVMEDMSMTLLWRSLWMRQLWQVRQSQTKAENGCKIQAG